MGKRLGDFERMLLLALVRENGQAHGGRLRTVLAERTGRDVAAGAIYTAMERLMSRGLVDSRLGEPTPERGGRRKRFYRLLPRGEELLERSLDELRRMTRDLAPRYRLS